MKPGCFFRRETRQVWPPCSPNSRLTQAVATLSPAAASLMHRPNSRAARCSTATKPCSKACSASSSVKPAILVTGSIDRPDILAMFGDAASGASLTFLEYYFNYGVRAHPEYFQRYGPLRFWHEFAD